LKRLEGMTKKVVALMKLQERATCKSNIEAEDRAYTREEYQQHLDKIKDVSIKEGQARAERDYYQNLIDIKRSYFSLLKDMLKVR